MNSVSSAYAGHPGRGARLFIFMAVAVAIAYVPGCALTSGPTSIAQTEETARAREAIEFNQRVAMMAGQALELGKYRVGPEDVITVSLFDVAVDENASGIPRNLDVQVTADGYIVLPAVGSVYVKGLTSDELTAELSRLYSRYIHDAQVGVLVKEYRSYSISVVGYVGRPGILELRGRKTVLEALAMAGGLNDKAGRSVRLTRQTAGEMQTVLIDLERLANTGDVSLNVVMIPGDVLNVPRAGSFYVEGSVNSPGPYPLLTRTTVTQALATAGGPDLTLARLSGIVLYRQNLTGARTSVRIDLDSIRSGKTEDIVVAENDIVFVPLSGGKYFIDRFIGSMGFGFSLN